MSHEKHILVMRLALISQGKLSLKEMKCVYKIVVTLDANELIFVFSKLLRHDHNIVISIFSYYHY